MTTTCVYCGLTDPDGTVDQLEAHMWDRHHISLDEHERHMRGANPEGLRAPPSEPGELILPPALPMPGHGGYL